MKSTSIKSRLVSGLMLIVLFFLVQGGLVWYATSHAKGTMVENTRRNTVATSELGSLAVLAQQVRRYEKEYFVYVGNKTKRDSYEGEWRDAMDKIDATLVRMKTGMNGAFGPGDIGKVVAWRDASTFYAAEMEKIFRTVTQRATKVQADLDAAAVPAPATKPGLKNSAPAPAEQIALTEFRSTEVNDMIKPGKDRFSAELIKGVAAMDAEKTTATLALVDVAEKMFNQVLMGVMITVAIGIIVALLLSVSLPKIVSRTIDSLSDAVQNMSLGNLQHPYESGGVTEFSKLAEALNRMRLGQQALIERLQKRQ